MSVIPIFTVIKQTFTKQKCVCVGGKGVNILLKSDLKAFNGQSFIVLILFL